MNKAGVNTKEAQEAIKEATDTLMKEMEEIGEGSNKDLILKTMEAMNRHAFLCETHAEGNVIRMAIIAGQTRIVRALLNEIEMTNTYETSARP